MRRTVGAQLECQEPKANISLPALGNEGPHDRVVLGGVLRVVPALVLLRGRRRAAQRTTPPPHGAAALHRQYPEVSPEILEHRVRRDPRRKCEGEERDPGAGESS